MIAEEKQLKKLDYYTNSMGIQFIRIPAGEFMMGPNRHDSDIPPHKVKISKQFYLGKYPVTQKEWLSLMDSNPSRFIGDNNPVENVTWHEVQEFISKLNTKEGTEKYRLPSESEWEYACRAGTTTQFSFGGDPSKLGEYAWYNGYNTYEESTANLEEVYEKCSTHPVGMKKPNPWGLYDMHGNVWEWLQDTWHANYINSPRDGSAWEKKMEDEPEQKNETPSDDQEVDRSFFRAIRGGGWSRFSRCWSSSNRGLSSPTHRSNGIGFRLAMDV
ncbi:MAG: formylglycine-generating enzyme family protein [Methanolobus sp.]